MAGCLPALLQMPILYAMFRFFPSNIDLRGQSFLWADDLGAFDSVLDLPFSIPFYGAHVSGFTILDGGVHVGVHAHDHGQPEHAATAGHAGHEDHPEHHAVHDAVFLQRLRLGFELVPTSPPTS